MKHNLVPGIGLPGFPHHPTLLTGPCRTIPIRHGLSTCYLHNLQIIYIPVSIMLTVLSASGCVAVAEFMLPSRISFYLLGVKKEAAKIA
jgi:hypothetical protein